jgi:transcriptional regulator GlxA family with amidase domain
MFEVLHHFTRVWGGEIVVNDIILVERAMTDRLTGPLLIRLLMEWLEAMKNVHVLGFDGAFSTAITGVLDLLSLAGVTWQRLHGEVPDPRFRVRIVTEHGGLVRCVNGVEIQSHHSFANAGTADLILVPTIGGPIEKILQGNPGVVTWLQQQFERGADIASNCTGAFFLAEAGLLNGRQATTHWGFVESFRERYPLVLLKPEQLITEDGPVLCSGGGMAWFDLTLYLIERYAGHEIALATAKSYVIDMGRGSQKAYSALQGRRYHKDAVILEAQDWLENHFRDAVSLQDLADRVSLSARTFKRRFRQATGDTAITYLQVLRVEAAKQMLETTRLAVEQITRQVGYEDVSSFTRLFRRQTGLSPCAYRSKFNRGL